MQKKILIQGDPKFAVSIPGLSGEKFQEGERIAIVQLNSNRVYYRIVKRVIDQDDGKSIVEIL